MGSSDAREYVRSKLPDDFEIVECPDDKDKLVQMLPRGCRFGRKAFALMALDGLVPVGCIVRQFDNLYLYYDGVLYALDEDKQLIDDIPRFRPVRDGHEGRWVKYDPND